MPKTIDADVKAHDKFYDLVGRGPASEADWAARQATLGAWRQDPDFEPYWPAINHMLSDDLVSYQRRADAMKTARQAAADLEGYDFDAWRGQRDYDLQHAHDHLP